jgi:hypothetical protein
MPQLRLYRFPALQDTNKCGKRDKSPAEWVISATVAPGFRDYIDEI